MSLQTLLNENAFSKLKTKLRGLSPQANYTERPPLVGEVSANFWGLRVLRGQRNEFPRPLISENAFSTKINK
jgi:hypothetical protein